MPAAQLTALVLAGGRSRRFGQDKALLVLEGRTLLERAVDSARAVSDEILVVGRDCMPRQLDGVRAIPDDAAGIGPLGGLSTGLRAATHDLVLTIACDLPFVSVPLLHFLTGLPAGFDAAVPRWLDRPQPLLAVYRRGIAAAAIAQSKTGDYRLKSLLDRLNVWWVEEDQVRRLDPDPRCFTNINLPGDWQSLHQPR